MPWRTNRAVPQEKDGKQISVLETDILGTPTFFFEPPCLVLINRFLSLTPDHRESGWWPYTECLILESFYSFGTYDIPRIHWTQSFASRSHIIPAAEGQSRVESRGLPGEQHANVQTWPRGQASRKGTKLNIDGQVEGGKASRAEKRPRVKVI